MFGTAEPPIFQFACEVGRGRALLGSPLEHLSGIGGAGLTRAGAAAAAVGEAIERYSATYVPVERLIVASARELGDAAVPPERFALFSDAQHADGRFPFQRFTADTRVAWVEGRSVRGGGVVFVPAQLVFLGRVPARGGASIGFATSSGTACAEEVDETIVRCLFELLERDAFMLVWANRLSLPLLDIAFDPSIERLDRRLFACTGLRYAAIDLSVFHGFPIVLGVVRAPAGVPGSVGVGAGAGKTTGHAWWKALAEAFAARAAGVKLELLRGKARGDRHTAVVSFEDHIRYHAAHEHAASSRFLDSADERVPVTAVPGLEGDTPAAQIDALCRRIETAGSSAYAVDVTSPDVRELGLTVTKVLAPELCALDVAHSTRHLGGRRLYEAAAMLGLRSGVLREAEVNPDPHPFP